MKANFSGQRTLLLLGLIATCFLMNISRATAANETSTLTDTGMASSTTTLTTDMSSSTTDITSSTNTTDIASSTGDEAKIPCKDHCNKLNGECETEFGECRCYLGWYGETCDRSLKDMHPGAWYATRSLFIIFFALFMIFAIILLVVGYKQKNKAMTTGRLTLFNARNGSLISVVVLCLDVLMYYCLDPEGFENQGIPRGLRLFFHSVTFPILSTMLLIILFHWAEVYYFSVKLLRQEEMLEKINAKYKSNLTLEDVLSKIKFVNRLKMPFLVVNGIAYALSVVTFVFIGINHPADLLMIYIWAIVLSIIFFMEAVGFLYFGRRLVNVMPDNIKMKMKRITNLVTIETLVFCFVWIFTFVVGVSAPGPALFLTFFWIVRVAKLCVMALIFSGFLKFSRRFPYCFLVELRSTGSHDSGGATSDGGPTHSSNKISPVQSQDADEDSNVYNSNSNTNANTNATKEVDVEMELVESNTAVDLP